MDPLQHPGAGRSRICRRLPARLLAADRPPRPVVTAASQLGTRKQGRPPRYTTSVSAAVQVPEPEIVTPGPALGAKMVQVPLRTFPLAVGTPVPEKANVTGVWFSRKVAKPLMLPSSPAVPLPNPETSLRNTMTDPPKI